MKNPVFARPNLKVFLLGAVLILIVQQLVNNGLSQNSGPMRPLVVNAREAADADPELDRILALSGQVPASYVYALLSDYYEEKGKFRLALRYLRLSTLVAESEGE